MRLVVDANVLLAAFVRKSTTRRLLFSTGLELLAPEHLVGEASKHALEDPLIASKTGLDKSELEDLLALLVSRIKTFSEREYAAFLPRAIRLAVHEEDAPYLALALSLNCPVWSNDPDFLQQQEVKIVSTKELAETL